MPLKTQHHISSVKGLSSVTTLITGPTDSILIDPPFLLQDAESVVDWIRTTAPNTNLAAVFVTHHHPDVCSPLYPKEKERKKPEKERANDPASPR